MKPSELAITIATMPDQTPSSDPEGWVTTFDVRLRLQRLGFDCSTQQIVADLRRMAAVDLPWVERRATSSGLKQYRVTQWGSNDIQHKLGIDLETPWTRAR